MAADDLVRAITYVDSLVTEAKEEWKRAARDIAAAYGAAYDTLKQDIGKQVKGQEKILEYAITGIKLLACAVAPNATGSASSFLTKNTASGKAAKAKFGTDVEKRVTSALESGLGHATTGITGYLKKQLSGTQIQSTFECNISPKNNARQLKNNLDDFIVSQFNVWEVLKRFVLNAASSKNSGPLKFNYNKLKYDDLCKKFITVLSQEKSFETNRAALPLVKNNAFDRLFSGDSFKVRETFLQAMLALIVCKMKTGAGGPQDIITEFGNLISGAEGLANLCCTSGLTPAVRGQSCYSSGPPSARWRTERRVTNRKPAGDPYEYAIGFFQFREKCKTWKPVYREMRLLSTLLPLPKFQ